MEATREDSPGGVGSDMAESAAAGIGWMAAYLLYFTAFAATFGLALHAGPFSAALLALANTGPDAVGAPGVLWAVARVEGGRLRVAARLAALGAAYVVCCLAGTLGALWLWKAASHGSWRLPTDAPNVAWKCLFSMLVFGALAGVGRARYHARRAADAAARAHRAEMLRLEARLSILRAQLNPHFILNVLHSLVGLARRDPETTSTTLERLGTTLRYALRVQSRRCDRVPLREELEFTAEYLELERLRLGERLVVRLRTEEAALSRPVPPFVLQPLVENAIVHAIAPRASGGVVEVTIATEGGVLLVTVDDDGGPGPSPAAPRRPGSGLGLGLLRDRLDAQYGGRGALEIGPSPLGGTRARLRLDGEPAGADEEETE
ncbi:MAG: histidine kinase [Thermoanaerobaculia bacterium]